MVGDIPTFHLGQALLVQVGIRSVPISLFISQAQLGQIGAIVEKYVIARSDSDEAIYGKVLRDCRAHKKRGLAMTDTRKEVKRYHEN